MYIYDIALNYSYSEKCQIKVVEKIQITDFLFNKLFPKIVPVMR